MKKAWCVYRMPSLGEAIWIEAEGDYPRSRQVWQESPDGMFRTVSYDGTFKALSAWADVSRRKR